MSPDSGRDCVKSLRSFYTGLYPQSVVKGRYISKGWAVIVPILVTVSLLIFSYKSNYLNVLIKCSYYPNHLV